MAERVRSTAPTSMASESSATVDRATVVTARSAIITPPGSGEQAAEGSPAAGPT